MTSLLRESGRGRHVRSPEAAEGAGPASSIRGTVARLMEESLSNGAAGLTRQTSPGGSIMAHFGRRSHSSGVAGSALGGASGSEFVPSASGVG